MPDALYVLALVGGKGKRDGLDRRKRWEGGKVHRTRSIVHKTCFMVHNICFIINNICIYLYIYYNISIDNGISTVIAIF